ncbi:DUF2256 domain-containing protein [Pigmentiphaga litoralis]|uniref:DUF2256 domain-containing protein n=1 Tax=Pigmentiphaga litoralis TaxID=516702 RepID=UPI003B42AE8B
MPRGDTRLKSSHPGNKANLPSKPCQACGRPMTWRKAWSKNWESVRYCSDRCRAAGRAGPAGPARD